MQQRKRIKAICIDLKGHSGWSIASYNKKVYCRVLCHIIAFKVNKDCVCVCACMNRIKKVWKDTPQDAIIS